MFQSVVSSSAMGGCVVYWSLLFHQVPWVDVLCIGVRSTLFSLCRDEKTVIVVGKWQFPLICIIVNGCMPTMGTAGDSTR